MTQTLFGNLSDGTAIYMYTIGNDNITAKILSYGGILQSLIVGGTDVVCGYDTMED